MKEYFKKLAGDGFIYGLSGVISRFISIFIIPVYTRYFPPEKFAVINLINVTFVAIGIFVVMGLDNSAALWYWDKDSLHERKRTFSSWFWFLSLGALLVVALTAAGKSYWSSLILRDSLYGHLLLMAAGSFFFNVFSNVYTNWLKIQRKALQTVAFTLTTSLAAIGLAIYMVVWRKMGIEGVFLAQLMASMISFVYVLVAMRDWLHWKYFSSERLKEMLRFSLPLIPALVCTWLLSSAGVFFIQYFESKREVGLYQIGNTIATVMSLGTYAFINAWTPLAFSVQKKEDARHFYAGSFIVFVLYGSIILVALFLFIPEILYLFTTPEYYESALIAGLLSVNLLISSAVQIVSIGSAIAKNNKPYSKAVILGALLTVAGYGILVPLWGKVGCAIASILSTLLTVSLVYHYSQKLYFIPYEMKKVLWIAIISFTFCGAIFYFQPAETGPLQALLKTVVFLVYLGLIVSLFRKELMLFFGVRK